eukprot:TRINITY_DN11867_c0_g1_i1.p1 TRINITY_DN11867_c0_g1~~TRINITY_DN11867_c0_g1_i1.p1  ORF type:complete len:455 (-),score=65.08 TRINITY_DN11867_c0_g1_i1:47-1411(-)
MTSVDSYSTTIDHKNKKPLCQPTSAHMKIRPHNTLSHPTEDVEEGVHSDSENLLEATPESPDASSSFWWVTFNLWNDILGPGMIALPYYARSVGIWLLPPVLLFFSLVTAYTLNTLYYLSKKYRQPSYPELCRYSLGVPGTVVVCIFMFMFNFGGFLGALLMVGTNVPNLLSAFFGESKWFSRHYVLIFACFLFLPIAFFRKISEYAFTSFLSVVLLLVLTLVLFIRVIFESTPPADKHTAFHWVGDDFLPAIGGLSYLFVCHDMSFSVFESYHGSTRAKWNRVVLTNMLSTVIVFTILAYSGFFLFYTDCKANVLDNFDLHDVLANICRILLSINIMLSVPYSVFIPRVALYSLISLFLGKKIKHVFFHVLMTALIVGTGCVIAEFVTDLGTLFELVGAISAVGIAFIIPPIIFLKLEPGQWSSPKKIANILVLIFGISVMTLSTSSIIQNNV